MSYKTAVKAAPNTTGRVLSNPDDVEQWKDKILLALESVDLEIYIENDVQALLQEVGLTERQRENVKKNDIITKPLLQAAHERFVHQLGMMIYTGTW